MTENKNGEREERIRSLIEGLSSYIETYHGGEVELWSRPGRGSTFTVRLASVPAPVEPVRKKKLKFSVRPGKGFMTFGALVPNVPFRHLMTCCSWVRVCRAIRWKGIAKSVIPV